MIRRLIVPVAATVVAFHAAQAMAQGAFPAPLPGSPGKVGTVNDPAFPPVNGRAPAPSLGSAPAPALGNAPASAPAFGSAPAPAAFPGPASSPFAAPPTQAGAIDACMKEFLPMREEAERRGKLLRAASTKRVGPDEACKLIKNFIEAEVKMMKYVETNSARCGIPPQIAEQLKAGHKHTDDMKTKVCTAAEQMAKQGPAGPSLSEVLGSATQLPEVTPAKKTGGVFDTLNGNSLTR